MSDVKFIGETMGHTIHGLYEAQYGKGSWPGPPDRTHLADPMRLGDILEAISNPPTEAGFPVKEQP